MRVQSLSLEDTLEEGMQPTPVFWPGESHGRRACLATIHGVTESDMTERMSTHAHKYRIRVILIVSDRKNGLGKISSVNITLVYIFKYVST